MSTKIYKSKEAFKRAAAYVHIHKVPHHKVVSEKKLSGGKLEIKTAGGLIHHSKHVGLTGKGKAVIVVLVIAIVVVAFLFLRKPSSFSIPLGGGGIRAISVDTTTQANASTGGTAQATTNDSSIGSSFDSVTSYTNPPIIKTTLGAPPVTIPSGGAIVEVGLPAPIASGQTITNQYGATASVITQNGVPTGSVITQVSTLNAGIIFPAGITVGRDAFQNYQIPTSWEIVANQSYSTYADYYNAMVQAGAPSSVIMSRVAWSR